METLTLIGLTIAAVSVVIMFIGIALMGKQRELVVVVKPRYEPLPEVDEPTSVHENLPDNVIEFPGSNK